MDNIEMLKALYDFQAVYPKTISFDEGEYFILYQTSARQRNWWQVVSMKGNIGFVPSNYVMKIKVEPEFLISFLNSSIESLEKSKETDINGIMPKQELLERLREKKNSMERMYLDNTEHDADSSFSFSQSLGGSVGGSSGGGTGGVRDLSPHQQENRPHSPPHAKRLDSNKKSISTPSMSGGVETPQPMQESPSLGSMQVQMQLNQQQQQQISQGLQQQHQQQQQQQQQGQSMQSAQSTPQVQTKVNDIAQDNSVTSEPSTTTTTTSEDVVTTYRETSLRDTSSAALSCHKNNQSNSHSPSHSHSLQRNRNGTEEEEEEVDADVDVDDDEQHTANDYIVSNHVNGNGDDADGDVDDDDDDNNDNDDYKNHKQHDKLEVRSDERKSDLKGKIKYINNRLDDRRPMGDGEHLSIISNMNTGDSGTMVIGNSCGSGSGDLNYLRPHRKVESSDVYQMVDAIRRNTNMSFDISCEALRVVLTSMEQLYNGAINPYLEAIAVHVTDKVETPKELLGMTHDARRLQYIFSQLADCKNDTQQRSWMVYEDEDDIVQFLEELVEILNNADENICCYEMSSDQYQAMINLVQYYQMETRWPIKRLLLKAFIAACHLDAIIVDILVTSVLPLEIVEDMKVQFSTMERLKELIKMLSIIFCLGQAMPINHQDYLGVQFAEFLLETVESNNPENFVDLVVTLILAFNLQFSEATQNPIVEAMQTVATVKVFTEKLLLLLNREEDPVKLLKHPTSAMNSVLKMFIDIFSVKETAGLFYTTDNKVLIDIVVRQLSDLCAGNALRRCYLELCRRIMRNTNYQEHQHRKQDFMKIFTRIFCEDTECSASDQQLVREIANEFPQLFKA